MTVRCYILGHKRSRSRAWFDDKLRCWFSDCKRCRTLLRRQDDGAWQAEPPRRLRSAPCATVSLDSRSFTILLDEPSAPFGRAH